MEAIVRHPSELLEAFLVRRRMRFLVDVEFADGSTATAHTNNTGSMAGLLASRRRVLLSVSDNPRRKLPYTLEAVDLAGSWVGVNTLTPNRMLKAAWQANALPAEGYAEFRSEARVGNSRLDGLLTGPAGRLWVECKNVTLAEYGVALFPDAPTERGRKHLHELMELASQGDRVALFLLVQRPDGECFGPADFIDPEYASLFYRALDAGVEAWPFVAAVDRDGVRLGKRLPVTQCFR